MAFDPAYATIFPRTTQVAGGRMRIGGLDAQELTREFGSPLYVFDETELRAGMREYRQAFESRYADTEVTYASKAYLSRFMAAVCREEGIGLDIVSGGELAIALAAGFPVEHCHFHGNNKGEEELREALAAGVGRIIVDNFHELELLDRVARAMGTVQRIILRLSPGVDAHTHAKTTTGTLDTKFGLPISTGHAAQAVADAQRMSGVDLVGLHCHLGSPLFDIEPYDEANRVMLGFAAEMVRKHGMRFREYSPGGGFAAQYVRERPAPPVEEYAETIVSSFRRRCAEHGLPLPRLFVEPGRSLVARAGVALYTAGARKEIEGLRT
ncbi:MAG TPA: diaminopimelate decarboxylase, partial [Dehalococcoidia bacterium]|nr:diaminopimelate decarboxylase [Dehalococcoidia bacterium]